MTDTRTLALDGVTAIPRLTAREMANARPALVVDLRSPSEFAEDHVPGAVNVPLFDDVQRALVGTLYRQVSPSAAFDEGRAIVRSKIRDMVGEISRVTHWSPRADDVEARVERMTSGGYDQMAAALMSVPSGETPNAPIVMHCWRGGLRSRSVIGLVRALGLDRATMLVGGYKGYRAFVNEELGCCTLPQAIVLRGLTGVGKTLVLREIERLRHGSTLDLEFFAGHRSSLLGMVGLKPCSQKTFESRLCERITRGFGDFVIMEGESRKVGDAIVPNRVWSALTGGVSVHVDAALDRRVEVLCRDYLADDASRAELRARLPHVEERLTRATDAPSLVSMLDAGSERELVELLLERYYDPLYRHSQKGLDFAARFDASDPTRAAREILAWVDDTFRSK
jgi:tRNA 2-selenouridine synthase